MKRRQALSAAWSLPVIAAAVAAPAVSASIPPAPEPLDCRRIPGKGQPQWLGIYTDGSTVTMTNGDAMSGIFGPICRAAGNNPGAGH